MLHKLEKEFLEICKIILDKNKNLQEWSKIESSGMFQVDPYNGGFDTAEQEFTFSYYDKNNQEFWFQVSLDKIQKIFNAEILEIPIRPAEYHSK